jgi:hypothetical protein
MSERRVSLSDRVTGSLGGVTVVQPLEIESVSKVAPDSSALRWIGLEPVTDLLPADTEYLWLTGNRQGYPVRRVLALTDDSYVAYYVHNDGRVEEAQFQEDVYQGYLTFARAVSP